MDFRLARMFSMGIAALALAACGTPIEIPGYAASGDGGASSSTDPTSKPGPSRSDGGYSGSADSASMAPEEYPGSDPTGSGQEQPTTGVLTAGSIDDHLNPEIFDAFLEDMTSYSQKAPSLVERAQIVVRSSTGAPLGNALVRVRDGDGALLLEARTGTDGRTLFVPALDGAPEQGPLTVEASAGGVSGSGTFDLDAASWELTLAAAAIAPTKLDVAFLVDTTGSMGDELAFLKAETANIAAKVAAQYPHVDMRFGLVVYRDSGDAYVTRRFDFSDLATFQQNIDQQSYGGGGDYPEAMHEALAVAAQQLSWREGNVARVAFLLADAPPHDQYVSYAFESFDVLRKAAVRLYPVASSGVADLAEFVMRGGAFLTLARYLFLTDDSGVGGTHQEPHKPAEPALQPCYQIEKLEQLMIRMIGSELAGKLLFPDPSTVLRTVGNPVDGVCVQPEPQPDPAPAQ